MFAPTYNTSKSTKSPVGNINNNNNNNKKQQIQSRIPSPNDDGFFYFFDPVGSPSCGGDAAASFTAFFSFSGGYKTNYHKSVQEKQQQKYYNGMQISKSRWQHQVMQETRHERQASHSKIGTEEYDRWYRFCI